MSDPLDVLTAEERKARNRGGSHAWRSDMHKSTVDRLCGLLAEKDAELERERRKHYHALHSEREDHEMAMAQARERAEQAEQQLEQWRKAIVTGGHVPMPAEPTP